MNQRIFCLILASLCLLTNCITTDDTIQDSSASRKERPDKGKEKHSQRKSRKTDQPDANKPNESSETAATPPDENLSSGTSGESTSAEPNRQPGISTNHDPEVYQKLLKALVAAVPKLKKKVLSKTKKGKPTSPKSIKRTNNKGPTQATRKLKKIQGVEKMWRKIFQTWSPTIDNSSKAKPKNLPKTASGKSQAIWSKKGLNALQKINTFFVSLSTTSGATDILVEEAILKDAIQTIKAEVEANSKKYVHATADGKISPAQWKFLQECFTAIKKFYAESEKTK